LMNTFHYDPFTGTLQTLNAMKPYNLYDAIKTAVPQDKVPITGYVTQEDKKGNVMSIEEQYGLSDGQANQVAKGIMMSGEAGYKSTPNVRWFDALPEKQQQYYVNGNVDQDALMRDYIESIQSTVQAHVKHSTIFKPNEYGFNEALANYRKMKLAADIKKEGAETTKIE